MIAKISPNPKPWRPVLIALLASLAVQPAWGGTVPIFSSSFADGDLAEWSAVTGDPVATCAAGAGPTDALGGALGEIPGGLFRELGCVEIRNDLPFSRRELAVSAVPLPRELGLLATTGLALIDAANRQLAAQFEVLSRWGGRVDDTSRPIRWLQVSVPAELVADAAAWYSLRRYVQPPSATDPFAAAIVAQGGGFVVSTGLADFTLDPANPALLTAVAVDLDDDGVGLVAAYAHSPGAGPRLVFDASGVQVALDTTDPAQVVVDPGSFEIHEAGPARVVVSLRGHFVDSAGRSRCTRDGLDYERFGYTLVATFERGRRDVGLDFHPRNECSDALGGSWTDDAVTIHQVSWELPLGLATPTLYTGGSGALAASAPGFSASAAVEQRKGAGSPWARRARVRVGGVDQETAEAFETPFLALGDGQLAVGLHLGWMRFREPQALAAESSTLSLRPIGETLVVGEGKGIWNRATLSFTPTPGGATAPLENARRDRLAAIERGLLVRLARHRINAAGLFPSLGTDAASEIKTAYLSTLETLHTETVGAGGQWPRAKTYGSQLWPDVQVDPFDVDHPDPASNSGAMNYWNASGAELLEFLRSGDPRWAWDFALPQSWLQAHSAYLNLGDHDHGNRNGVAVTSGGAGEGQWHRSAFGSDDYTYNRGLHLAYVLRPHPALRQRLAEAGRTIVDRYDIPQAQQALRDPFVNAVEVARGPLQHFEMLANCAEFVPGAQGQACEARLLEILAELASENLRAGVFCAEDLPQAGTCGLPQQFMQSAMMYAFFDRLYRDYGDVVASSVAANLHRALVEAPAHYYDVGIAKGPGGVAIDVGGNWAALLECNLLAGDTQVGACTWLVTSDGLNLLRTNKPHTLALLLAAHQLDPSVDLCGVSKAALDDSELQGMWAETMFNQAGWLKATAQMMQWAVFAVGGYDVCGGS